MFSLRTTVVTVISSGEFSLSESIQGANVSVFQDEPVEQEKQPLERAVRAWQHAARVIRPYFVHDADPLAAVAEAYVRHFDEQGIAGELEIAVSQTISRWRARSFDLPDYYLVRDPETLAPTMRHWFFGVLATAAPTRVVALGSAQSIDHELTRLRSGTWWPDLDLLLDHLAEAVPDQVGRLATTQPAPLLAEESP